MANKLKQWTKEHYHISSGYHYQDIHSITVQPPFRMGFYLRFYRHSTSNTAEWMRTQERRTVKAFFQSWIHLIPESAFQTRYQVEFPSFSESLPSQSCELVIFLLLTSTPSSSFVVFTSEKRFQCSMSRLTMNCKRKPQATLGENFCLKQD